MNKPYQDIKLLDFQKKFQTEEDCEKHLFKFRWPEGFICPRCGYTKYYSFLSANCINAVNADIKHL